VLYLRLIVRGFSKESYPLVSAREIALYSPTARLRSRVNLYPLPPPVPVPVSVPVSRVLLQVGFEEEGPI
jgi:hypothetical protein